MEEKQERHRVEIYHEVSSTGLFWAGCTCGWESGKVVSGSDAYFITRHDHPEGLP